MGLPTLEAVQALLKTGGVLKQTILSMAKRLEALEEYSSEQALIVAADIVRSRLRGQMSSSTKGVG
jgi:hypothetical protein